MLEDDHAAVLFVTGSHHTGEVMDLLVADREPSLPPPIFMGDCIESNTVTTATVYYAGSNALVSYYLGLFSLLALVPLLGVAGLIMAGFALVLGIKGLRAAREVVRHLEPRVPTSDEQIDQWAYRYGIDDRGAASGPPYYSITVDNISLFETLATEDHPLGGQDIEVVVTFETTDVASITHYYRAHVRAGYVFPDVREPANGRVALSDADFVQWSD